LRNVSLQEAAVDQRSFDQMARLLAGAASRRTGLKAAVGALFGAAVLPAPADARKSRSQRPETEGPCGNGKRKDNQCTKDSQCCTGICDVSKGKKNKDKKGRCRCLKNGKPCAADKNCCKSSVCFDGSCTDCRKSNQSCFDSGDCCGTGICSNYICIPCRNDGQSCSASADCCSGFACYDGTCAPCASVGTTCTADSQCCDGSLCLDGVCASCIPEGGSCAPKLTAASHGDPREFALDCCGSLLCHNATCVGPQSVRNGDPCIEDYDSCEDPDATCTTYQFDTPAGTYCLLPRKAVCEDDLDCISRDCPGGVCVACSHEACITPCVPIVCKGNACTYDTIQDAINAATSGDVIDIGPGQYVEDLTVDRDIVLRACKGKPVTIQNATYDTRTISVTGDFLLELIDITVEGLSDIEGGKYGGGIATPYNLGLFRYTTVRNGAWDAGGGIRVGGYNTPGSLGAQSSGAANGNRASATQSRFAERRASLAGRTNRFSTAGIEPSNGSYTLLLAVDQTLIETNTADALGGGIYAGWIEDNGFIDPSNVAPSSVIIVADGAVIRYNDAIQTSPLNLDAITPANFDSAGGGIFANNGIVELQDDAIVFNNNAGRFGGGIYLMPTPGEYGFLMTGNSAISRNRANGGGGLSVYSTLNADTAATVMLDDSSIYENKADSYAAGLLVTGVPVYMEDKASIRKNIGLGLGGGAVIDGTFPVGVYGLNMTDETSIKDNTSVSYSAGVLLSGVYGHLEGSATITGNVAETNGGGVFLEYVAGSPNYLAGITIEGSATITGNVAANGGSGNGGGVYSDNPANEVEGGERITDNDPDDCYGSSSASCIA
jgi:hypothetical protein